MKNSVQIVLTLLYSAFIFSQEKTISGTIMDSLKKPIKYANIGILHKPIGTVSNENGEFTFVSDKVIELDTLKFSCVGYKSKQIILKNTAVVVGKFNVTLDDYIEKLDEVIISPSNLKSYTEGKQKTETQHAVFFSNPNLKNINLGSEMGRKFSLGDKKISLLSEFKFFIKDNNFEMVKFRINFYTIKNNKPDKQINKSNIIVQVNSKLRDWVNVDLSAYEIKIQEDIIVTVEWIEHSNDGTKLNLPIIIPSFGSTHYYKFGSQGTWLKYGNISSPMVLLYKQ